MAAKILYQAMFPALIATPIILAFAIFPQPIVYDAAQYQALAQEIRWDGILPTLPADGLRTYAYPFLVRLAGYPSVLYVVQGSLLVLLMVTLRRQLAPPGMSLDLTVAFLFLLLPVLATYSAVMLADLIGVIAIQFGLLMAASLPTHRRRAVALGAGACLGFAVQLRPAYYHFALVVLVIASLWIIAENIGAKNRAGRFRAGVLLIGVLWVGSLVPAIPTMAVQFEKTGRVEILPWEGIERLKGYHLMLGLWMDRWSSNPPPLEEKARVADAWSKIGWAITPIEPWPVPSVADYYTRWLDDPAHAMKQCVKHIAHAFQKSELFAYQGTLNATGQLELWAVNLVVLTLGLFEMFHRARSRAAQPGVRHRASKFGSLDLPGIRRFAQLQILLFLYLAATCALVVPEERFTLALYPVVIVMAASPIHQGLRWLRSVGHGTPCLTRMGNASAG